MRQPQQIVPILPRNFWIFVDALYLPLKPPPQPSHGRAKPINICMVTEALVERFGSSLNLLMDIKIE